MARVAKTEKSPSPPGRKARGAPAAFVLLFAAFAAVRVFSVLRHGPATGPALLAAALCSLAVLATAATPAIAGAGLWGALVPVLLALVPAPDAFSGLVVSRSPLPAAALLLFALAPALAALSSAAPRPGGGKAAPRLLLALDLAAFFALLPFFGAPTASPGGWLVADPAYALCAARALAGRVAAGLFYAPAAARAPALAGLGLGAALLLFAPPRRRTVPGEAPQPDVPRPARAALAAALCLSALYAVVYVFSDLAVGDPSATIPPFGLLPAVAAGLAFAPGRFARPRRGVAALSTALFVAIQLGAARQAPAPAGRDAAAPEPHGDAWALALVDDLNRNGVSRLAAIGPAPGGLALERRMPALSGGTIVGAGGRATVYGREIPLDEQTAVLVPDGDAEAARDAFARAGLSMRQAAGHARKGLFVPTSNQAVDFGGGVCSGLYERGGRLVAAPSAQWVRQQLDRLRGRPAEADGYARVFASAPTSTALLLELAKDADPATSERILGRLRLSTTPAIGGEVRFGRALVWKGARLLDGADAARHGGTVRIRHYWRLASDASATLGALVAQADFAAEDGRAFRDEFALDLDAAAITDDDPDADAATFFTDRAMAAPPDAPPGAWTLKVGVLDRTRLGYPLRASSSATTIHRRRAVVRGALLLPPHPQGKAPL